MMTKTVILSAFLVISVYSQADGSVSGTILHPWGGNLGRMGGGYTYSAPTYSYGPRYDYYGYSGYSGYPYSGYSGYSSPSSYSPSSYYSSSYGPSRYNYNYNYRNGYYYYYRK
ncbi:unnamed protein product [Bursaphelenchus xylophilus]|uniref:(pine wood nematode) hypothetical protein n=1 Tax=Bursaphelenchus xylophilus TaxID=6326 RepID=A0A1I7SM76_BURXY|nr:unnamed protein product [Bursaphelenchus xylophilus]CAG9130024.1 unnamed protein product [Bursaphelenchus xylophilus]